MNQTSGYRDKNIRAIPGCLFFLAVMYSLGAHATTSYSDLSKAPGVTYALENTHAYVGFTYSHMGFSNPKVFFRDVDATLELNPDDIRSSKLSVTIDPASIDSGVMEFDEHLLSSDMFDLENHKTIKFVSTEIREKKNGSLEVDGDLTIKGIASPVTLNVNFNKGGLHFKEKIPQLGFSATSTVDRRRWDLGYGMPFVGAEMDLIIEVEFLRAE